jgi:cytochrome P450
MITNDDRAVAEHEAAIPFTQPRQCPFDPPPAYAKLQKEQPISRVTLWNGNEAWLITRHADVRAVLTHPAVSADVTLPNYPFTNPGMEIARGNYPAFITMDDPKHNDHRRMVVSDFLANQVKTLQPEIQRTADELIAAMLAGGPPADFLKEVALPLPSRVICKLLGVPYERHDFFQARAEVMVSPTATREEAVVANRELIDEYLGELVRQKDGQPADDIISRLVVEQLRPGNLTLHELVSMLRLLLVAGHESTANTATLGVLLFLRHPDQLEKLQADPSLIGAAVEEVLRIIEPTQAGRRRVAIADFEIAGQKIKAGDAIIALNSIASRDPAVFPDPDRFDITRNPRNHLAFGFGPHICLGNALARLELATLIGTVFRAVPTLRLATPFEALEFQPERVVYGVKSLPVAW